MSDPRPVRHDPIFAVGVWGLSLYAHVGVALGLMKHALREVALITTGKERLGYPDTVDDHALFLHGFAQHEALYRAARALAMETYTDFEHSAKAGRAMRLEQQARSRQIPTWVTHVASEVVRFCHLWGGTQAFRNPSDLGRISRDTAVATQHALTDPVTMVDAAKPILAAWRETVSL